jgi:DNA-binding Xre family transcriptional regulator
MLALGSHGLQRSSASEIARLQQIQQASGKRIDFDKLDVICGISKYQ